MASILFLAYRTTISSILNQWDSIGVFDYLLPFLLVFAIIFGILDRSKFLGPNKGVSAVIALAAGLLSLQFNLVTDFFATIFPYLGVGISIILVALILMSFFWDPDDKDKNKTYKIIFMALGGIVAFIVIISALGNSGISRFSWYYSSSEAIPAIVAGVLLIGLIAWMIKGNK